MNETFDLRDANEKVLKIKQLLIELESCTDDFPALLRNSKRALASVKMMELNISDVAGYDLID